MSGIEDSLRDTVSYINEQISDSARSTKNAMGGSVSGTPIATFSLVGFTVILISVMLFRNGGKEEENANVLPDEEQMIGEETSPSNPLDMEPIQAENNELVDENEMGQQAPPVFDNAESPYTPPEQNENQGLFNMQQDEAPQPEAPSAEAPSAEAPPAEAPPAEAPQPEAPPAEAPPAEAPPANPPQEGANAQELQDTQTGGKKRKTNKKKKKAKRKQTNKKKR